ncbi:hypothetical protein B0H14DRAFT_2582631 [Mycena olivaceomarginata]|nr:hypothetical protein B0H14DRAFT_2582631 [Mycena olivaceomarginata]
MLRETEIHFQEPVLPLDGLSTRQWVLDLECQRLVGGIWMVENQRFKAALKVSQLPTSSEFLVLLQNTSRSKTRDVKRIMLVQIILGRASKDVEVVIVHLAEKNGEEAVIDQQEDWLVQEALLSTKCLQKICWCLRQAKGVMSASQSEERGSEELRCWDYGRPESKGERMEGRGGRETCCQARFWYLWNQNLPQRLNQMGMGAQPQTAIIQVTPLSSTRNGKRFPRLPSCTFCRICVVLFHYYTF